MSQTPPDNQQQRAVQCRIDELVAAFTKSGYPKEMLLNKSKKVIDLERNVNEQHGDAETVSKSDILVVSCYGTDAKLTSTLQKHQNSLLQTNSFKNSAKPLFRFVKRTAANLGSKLAVLKSIALDDQSGETRPCNGHANCKCCKLIDDPTQQILGRTFQAAPGDCKSKT